MADLVLPVEALPIQKKNIINYGQDGQKIHHHNINRRSTAIHTVAKLKRQKAVSVCSTGLQGVPTSLGYAKCNVLKRKVCEQNELRLKTIDPPLKRGEF